MVECEPFYTSLDLGGNCLPVREKEVAEQRECAYSPNDIPNMVDRVSVIPRVDTCNLARNGLELGRPRWSHQSLRGRDESREENPSREGGYLGIGEH